MSTNVLMSYLRTTLDLNTLYVTTLRTIYIFVYLRNLINHLLTTNRSLSLYWRGDSVHVCVFSTSKKTRTNSVIDKNKADFVFFGNCICDVYKHKQVITGYILYNRMFQSFQCMYLSLHSEIRL